MSYQVIARKYRPQRFADVVGQDHVTQTLANAVRQNRIAHAYLFVGPRGTGKTTLARIFAKCLNCTDGPRLDFTDDDPRCAEIAEGRSLDVLEIDGASNRGIDEIRELRETVKYAPASSRFKIYIIDEVHMLTKEAFNALLKTLEEPPAHVKFMFATTEPEKVLPTILSRCQRFDLRRIPAALIVRHLAHIASQEQVEIDEPALFAIARGADGGMRDAESTFDQLISFCGDRISEPEVLSMFGLAAESQILSLAAAVLAADSSAALHELDSLVRNGKDLGRLLSDLMAHFRNLLLYQVSGGDLRMIEASEQEIAALKAAAPRLPTEAVGRVMDVLTEAETRLRDASSRRIVIELALLKSIQARGQISLDAVLRELQQLRSSAGGASARPDPASASESPKESGTAAVSVPVAKPRAHPPTGETVRETVRPVGSPQTDLRALWQEILSAVGRASPFTRSYLLEAHPVSLKDGVLTVGFDPEFSNHIALVDNAKSHALLQTKLQELGHASVQIKFIEAEAPQGWVPQIEVGTTETPAPPAPAADTPMSGSAGAQRKTTEDEQKGKTEQASMDNFRNDPLIQKALEVFKGHIANHRA